MLIVLNLLPHWNLSAITENYRNVLWAINMSLVVQMAGCSILILIHPLFLHHLVNVVFAAVSLVALGVVYTIFPVDFSRIPVNQGSLAVLNTLFRVALIVGMVGAVISILVHIVKAIRYLLRPEY
jgi:hypothetical protein